MMAKIVLETEGQDLPRVSERGQPGHVRLSVAETICESMAHAAEDLDISAIAVFTETGTTARQLSKYRPKSPIFGLSSVECRDPSHDPALGCAPHPVQQAGHRGTDGRDRRAPARRGGPRAAAADSGHRRRHPDQVGLDQFSPPARAGRHPLRGGLGARRARWRIPAANGSPRPNGPARHCPGGCAPAAESDRRSESFVWTMLQGALSRYDENARLPSHPQSFICPVVCRAATRCVIAVTPCYLS